MSDFLSDLLSPFRYFNFPSFYDQYATLIDGIVFYLLFLSLAKFVFSKYYKGFYKGVSWAIAAMLTIGLLSVEGWLNFNLKSFAWVAIGVIFFILSRFVFDLLKHGGMKFRTAFSLTYFTLYMSVAAIHPNIFDRIASRAPFLNGIAGLLCLASLFIILMAAFTSITKGREKIQVQDLQPAAPDNSDQDIKIEGEEIRKIKEIRGKLVTVDDIIDRLTRIEKIVKDHPTLDDKQIRNIRSYLEEMQKKEKLFVRSYNDAIYRFNQLRRIDAEKKQRLEDEFKGASDAQKRFIEAELDIESKLETQNKIILDLKRNLDLLVQNFINLINATIGQLNSHPQSSLPGIGQARAILSQINVTISDLKQLERELISLHKTQRELHRGQKRKR